MSDVKVRHRGLHPYRYKDNPTEKAFALAWQQQESLGGGNLAYMLGDGHRLAVVKDRERLVANTIIQWLGSPVGRGFLESVGFRQVSDREAGDE